MQRFLNGQGQLTEPFEDLICRFLSCETCNVHVQVVCPPDYFSTIACNRAAAGQVDACEIVAKLDSLLAESVCGLGSKSEVELTINEDDNGVVQ